MKRRNFIAAGIGGGAGLSMAQRVSRAQCAPAELPSAMEITVVGVDGADLTVPYLNDYLNTGATVWQYSGNTIDFGRFDKIHSFVNANASKVTLAKSYSDILAAQQVGKIAIV